MNLFYPISAALLLAANSAAGAVVEQHLEVKEEPWGPAGKAFPALTVNRTIPGPVLRFQVGDTARISVKNALKGESLSVHWHGLLLPNAQDGVPHLTTRPIPEGGSHVFEFPLLHSGTYWYHSHTGLQEQRGVYGAIVVAGRPTGMREEVLVLSDWTEESPEEVMRTLMRGSDWYNIRKGTSQSILGAISGGHSKEYWNRERTRMPAMDVSDVAYSAFWVNGQPTQRVPAKPGETIKLRVINAAASTYFYLLAASGPLRIVAADGMDVAPISQKRLLIGIGETYDVLATLPRGLGAWELRATAQDGSGHASVFLGSGTTRPAPDIPRLNPYSMTAALTAVLDQLEETGEPNDAKALAKEKPRPLPPYLRLRSTKPTTLPRSAPVRTVQVQLNGDMQRYVWTLNGTTLTEDSVLPVNRGELLRLVLRNDSMMHHPMHLHGHFFRLLMDGGPDARFAPLKHTVDVPPMSTRTIEFLANESKDWAFHCHLLYHMHAGMMKVLRYPAEGTEPLPPLDLTSENPFYFLLDATLQTHMTMGFARAMNAKLDLGVMWKAAWAKENHSEMPTHGQEGQREYEVDLMAMRYLNPRWNLLAGVRLTNMPEDKEDTAFLGATYRLPYLVDLSTSVEHNGDLRASLAKSFQLTDRLSLQTRAEYDTAQDFMWGAGLHYTVTKQLGLTATYDSDHGLGAGISLRF